MQKTIISTGIATLFLASAAFAQAGGEAACSNATLQGSYGVVVTGSEPAPSVLPIFPSAIYLVGNTEAFIGVVVHTFDGSGKFTQVDNVKGYLSGPVFDRPGSGTYSVNADCSGSYSLIIPGVPFPVLVVRFVVVDGGKEFRGVVMTPQLAMGVANGRKMH